MNPNIIPKNAPISPKNMDSVKNIPRITLLVPPSAFRIPISLVLSTTDVYMVKKFYRKKRIMIYSS